ncbi:MAG: hypothetical protein IT299_03410 [Dehalococcoidia bacterium]|nr:hypothetical protein [Dehalococcoidia bacterium]
MVKWLVAGLLVLQAHFAASYLVPLDAPAQRTFGGLLRWAWPWSEGDHGLLGTWTPGAMPLAGFFIAAAAGSLEVLALLALFGFGVPQGWWRPLALVGAVASLVLLAGFFGPTKVLPLATGMLVAWLAWSGGASRLAP